MHADVLRAREDDAVDVGIFDQLLPRDSATARDEVEDAWRNSSVHRDFKQLVAKKGRGGCRLEDGRIPRDERAAGRTGRKRERKVKWRDDGPYAVRAEHARILFVCRELSEHRFEPVVFFDLFAVILDEVRGFFDIADAL